MKLFESNGLMVIGTGIAGNPSRNRKTGAIPQLWIMPTNHPTESRHNGTDNVVCGECPLRTAAGGGCYVLPVAVDGLWKRYKDTIELSPPWEQLHRRHPVLRVGAYGDPGAPGVVDWLAGVLSQYKGRVLGYTQQWREDHAQPMRKWAMASVYTIDEAKEAAARGWRYYRVTRPGESATGAGERICPHYVSGVTCQVCKLCTGSSGRGRSIVAPAHGSGSAAVVRVIEAREVTRG